MSRMSRTMAEMSQTIARSHSDEPSLTPSRALRCFLRLALLCRHSTAPRRLLDSTPNQLTVQSSRLTWPLLPHVSISTPRLLMMVMAKSEDVLMIRDPQPCHGVIQQALNPATVHAQ
jgi:hypothetical protein